MSDDASDSVARASGPAVVVSLLLSLAVFAWMAHLVFTGRLADWGWHWTIRGLVAVAWAGFIQQIAWALTTPALLFVFALLTPRRRPPAP